MATDLRDPRVANNFEELQQVVIDMYNLMNPFYSTVSAAYTTANVGAEFVEVTGSSAVTVSLHSNPKDKQQVIVKQSGTGAVTVDTADAATIDGSASKVYSAQYDCLTFLYSQDAGEWIIVSKYLSNLTSDLVLPNGGFAVGDSDIASGYLSSIQGAGEVDFLIGSTDAGGVVVALDGDSNGDGAGGDYAYLRHSTTGDFDLVNLKSGGDINLSPDGAAVVGSGKDFRLTSGFLNLGASSELTISAGVVTATRSRHTIDTQSDAASDDLDTISGGTDGDVLVLRPAVPSRTVVCKDGTGNLSLEGDFSMNSTADVLELMYDGSLSAWVERSRSNNG